MSITSLFINYCDLVSESSDIILRGLIEHSKIEILDFSNNFLDDKTGYMIARLISRQSERRDETVWKYGLRGEKPFNSDFKKGLISVNISDNFISDNSADSIAIALQNDVYLRWLNLSRNQIFLEGCKKLVRSMRRNMTLLNLDMRDNYGYNENIHKRILVKISRNIKSQFKNFNEYGVGYNKENNNLKNFINYDFFNVDIPQEFIEKYQIIQENEDPIYMNNYPNNQFNNNYLNIQNLQHYNNPFTSFGNGNFSNNHYESAAGSNFAKGNFDNNIANVYNNNVQNNNNDCSDDSEAYHSHQHRMNNGHLHNQIHNKERKYSSRKNSEINTNDKMEGIHTTKNSYNKNNKRKNNFDYDANGNYSSNKKVANSTKNKNYSMKDKINENNLKNKHSNNASNKNTNKKKNIKEIDIKHKNQDLSNFESSNYNNNKKNNNNSLQNKSKLAKLEEKRFEYKVEKSQKNENKSKSEDIQFEIEADNEYDKIINEENENDDDIIFRNYSDGEIFCKNEITNDINYSLPQNYQTNFDTYFAKDNSNKNVEDFNFNYNKNATKYFEKNKFCRCSRDFKKIYVDINKKNKILFFENLKLRKQLLTVRAINLSMNQQRLNNNCNLRFFL